MDHHAHAFVCGCIAQAETVALEVAAAEMAQSANALVGIERAIAELSASGVRRSFCAIASRAQEGLYCCWHVTVRLSGVGSVMCETILSVCWCGQRLP